MNSKQSGCVLALAPLIFYDSPDTATEETTPGQTPHGHKQKTKKELEQKALVMLDEIIKDTQAFRVAENRLRLKAISASLLWKHDEARARILVKEALTGIADLLANQDEDDVPASHILQGSMQLRREVVQ